MKRQITRLTTALCLLAATPLTASAQSDDFGLQGSVGITKKISKKWNASAEAEFRTRDDTQTADRWSVGVSATYKVLPWLKASAGYTLLYDNNERISYYDATDGKVIDGDADEGDPKKRAEYWGTRHRLNLSLAATQRIGDFKVSLRERWQYTYRPEHTVDQRWSYLKEEWDGKAHTYSGKGKNVLRSRLQVEYAKKKQPVKPFASVELFNAWNLQKVRYTAGAEWDINKHHALNAFYRYQTVNDDDDDNEPNRHVIGLGYSFKF